MEVISGEGLVAFGKWLAERHDRYKQLMQRIQQMIATITIAEKAERAKDKQIQKALLGYDPEVCMDADLKIRDEDQEAQTYQKELPPPICGKHKFPHC